MLIITGTLGFIPQTLETLRRWGLKREIKVLEIEEQTTTTTIIIIIIIIIMIIIINKKEITYRILDFAIPLTPK